MTDTVAEPSRIAPRAAATRPEARRLQWVSGRAAIAREQWLTGLAAVLARGAALPVISDSIALGLHHARAGAFFPALASLGLIVLAGTADAERLAFAATFATLSIGVRGPDEPVLAAA